MSTVSTRQLTAEDFYEWCHRPENRTATVLLPNQLPQVLEENDEITGAPAFPDLRCRVADLFFVPEQ